MTRKVIMIELNELCPPLLERWMADGSLPNFRRFYENSEIFVTDSDEHDPYKLEPWIQWYSLHTGLPFERHGVFHLTDGPLQSHDDVWQLALRAGKRVGNMSSMNARSLGDSGCFYVPDAWADEPSVHPAELRPYVNFITRQVQEHTARGQLTVRDAASFVTFMLRNGLRAKTVIELAEQLIREKIGSDDRRWKRASLLDRLQLDVFLRLYEKTRPDFCTFFSNSTAHYQHAYWRNMEPERFSIKPSADELRQYGGAVKFGYQRMDALLGDFFDLERRHGATLVFATALSQQPYLDAETRGGQLYYRPTDFTAFLGSQGIAADRVEPIMTAQYILRCADPASTRATADALTGFRLGDTQIFEVLEQEPTKLCVGNWIHSAVPKDAVITHLDGRAPIPYWDVFYLLPVMKSGRHHPDGAFWIKTGRQRVHSEKVSILSVLPTLLDLLEIDYDRARYAPSLITDADPAGSHRAATAKVA